MKRKRQARAVSTGKTVEHGMRSAARRTNAPSSVTVRVPLTLLLRGGRKTVISPVPLEILQAPKQKFDNALIKAIVRAHRWRQMIEQGDYPSITELAKAEGVNQSYACRLLRLTLMAPDIIETVLNGLQPPEWTLQRALSGVKAVWADQYRAFGFR